MINKHYKDLKNIKKNTKLMDYYFMGKYYFSPYMACEHACVYCDGRAEKYYVEGDFAKDIVIRRNLPGLLESKIANYRENGTFLIGSGISDPYQPVESSEKIMRKCLAIISEHKHAVAIMTKSDLVLRDLDLLDKINQKSRAILMVSLIYPSDPDRTIFEPLASSVEKRLNMIRQFKSLGITVYVLAMPLLPKIADDIGSVSQLFDQLKALKVDAIMPGGLTLRPGKQKDFYLKNIQTHYPELLDFYQELYKSNYPSGRCEHWYTKETMPQIYDALRSRKIPTLLPHYAYKACYPKYDELFFLIQHMKKLYQAKGIAINALKTADQAYQKWYLEQRTLFNRKRSMKQIDLEDLLWTELNTSSASILNHNEKLTHFMKQAIFDDKTFDYNQLKLI